MVQPVWGVGSTMANGDVAAGLNGSIYGLGPKGPISGHRANPAEFDKTLSWSPSRNRRRVVDYRNVASAISDSVSWSDE